MHGGEGEAGASVPWAGRLRAGRQATDDRTDAFDPRLDLPATTAATAGHRLGGSDEESLPWLEAPDEFDDAATSGGPFARLLLIGLVVLALVVGVVWWAVRASGPGDPDGSLIRAESGPYKVRPQAPGGKTFAGTGDTAYAVSEGEDHDGALAAAADGEDEAGAETTIQAADSGGVGVQVGAFMDPVAAEAGWSGLVQRNPILSGFSHRVVAGRGDIGTVYRLQAVTANAAAAASLCQALQDAGQDCQVKR